MKRVTWFVTGVVAGAGAVVVVGRRVRRRVADLAPIRVAERILVRSRGSLERVKEAIGDGRSAMAERELQLRSKVLVGRSDALPSPPPRVSQRR